MGAAVNIAAAAIARAAPVVFFTLIMIRFLLLVIACVEGPPIISQNIHKSITQAQVANWLATKLKMLVWPLLPRTQG
jgi:hypothetical protein